jgi:hypothetical protein
VRKLFLVTSGVLLLVVVLQFYFAAVGAFTRPTSHDAYSGHATNAMVVLGAAVLVTIAAALARAGGRTIGLAALPILLVVMQIVIFIIAELFIPAGTAVDADGIPLEASGTPVYVVGLHALNGLLIFFVAVLLVRRARALAISSAPRPANHNPTPAT